MTKIAPFRAVRPPKDKVHLVASRSYVSYSRNDLNRKLSENPFTFIHIINPEFGQNIKAKPNSTERFLKVKERYQSFIDEGFLEEDDEPCLFIYRQITPANTFTGIVCGVAVDEYDSGTIKIHEHTLTEREEIFCKYLDICDFNAEPVLLTYRTDDKELNKVVQRISSEQPEYDFCTTDRIRHQLWVVRSKADEQNIISEFSNINELYIADGHHRSASSAKLAQTRNQNLHNLENKIAPHNFILSMIIPSSELLILPFQRLVELAGPCNTTELLNFLKKTFNIAKSERPISPSQNGQFGLRTHEGWFEVTIKQKQTGLTPAEMLDATLLTKNILMPYFGIVDPKTDKRLSYIPGNQSLDAIEQRIDKQKNLVLFSMKAVTPEELFAVADTAGIMPPKSTWIAPKLRSGLTIMPLS